MSHHHVTKPSSDSLLEKVKLTGNRITKVRRALVEIFSSESSPLTVPELISRLEPRGLVVNKTTVYRELAFLMTQKLVLEVDLLDGSKRYEVLDESNHHHHLVCTVCRDIKCIEMHEDLDALEKQIGRKHGFRVKSHVLEFFGICGRCG